jgi:hypothetical protein
MEFRHMKDRQNPVEGELARVRGDAEYRQQLARDMSGNAWEVPEFRGEAVVPVRDDRGTDTWLRGEPGNFQVWGYDGQWHNITDDFALAEYGVIKELEGRTPVDTDITDNEGPESSEYVYGESQNWLGTQPEMKRKK